MEQWGVDYVLVGGLERNKYKISEATLARFDAALKLVYDQDGVRIYAIDTYSVFRSSSSAGAPRTTEYEIRTTQYGVGMVATDLDKPTVRSETRLTDWLTVERAAYAGIVVLALGLRLYGLGRVPLGPVEAVQALPAWAAAAGQSYDLAGVGPLLFGLQWLLFALFGAGDAVARFWPALIGGLAPLLLLRAARPVDPRRCADWRAALGHFGRCRVHRPAGAG